MATTLTTLERSEIDTGGPKKGLIAASCQRAQRNRQQLASNCTQTGLLPSPIVGVTMIRSLVLFPIFLCCVALAQQPPQVTDKTPGQRTPDASPGSNLRQSAPSSVTPTKPAPASATPAPVTPGTSAPAPPTTTTTIAPESAPDPFLEPPPLPKGTVTLVGGTVRSIDHIRDHMTVMPFGGKPMKMVFDERTHIYRDGIETTFMGINKGDRVYVDTQLDPSKGNVFARNVHVVSQTNAADARGQIVAVRGGTITLQDQLSGQPVTFQLDSSTKVTRAKGTASTGAASTADLVPGALVAVQFSSNQANRRVLREVSLLAKPGDYFRFFGQVTHLDLSRGLMAVRNLADDQTYEIAFNPEATPATSSLRVGTQVVVNASFTGSGYRAYDVSVTQARVAAPQ